jgi:hypothetical protein
VLEKEVPVTCVWDGRDDAGDRVEPGRYRLRVTLSEEDRVMVFPKRLDVRVGDLEGDTEGYILVFEPCSQEEGE